MNKVYVIYEIREEDYKIINNLQSNYDIIKVLEDEQQAKIYFNNEINFQCNNDENWTYTITDENGMISANIYYCGEWQSCLCLKEMEVE